MKIRKFNESYSNLASDLRNAVYNALGDVAFEYIQKFEKEELADGEGYTVFDASMKDAIRFFNDRFWEEDDFEG